MIYVASKTKHADRWKAMRAFGVPINSSWIDEAGEGETKDYSDLWVRCINEVSAATCVVVYAEDGEILKGAFAEMGAAMAVGIPILVVGLPDTLSLLHHPMVVRFKDIHNAFKYAEQLDGESTQ